MKTEHAQRLLTLADFLDTLPPERFDYGHWVGEDWGGKPDLSCGTTACALGWATTIPEFAGLGLCLGDGDITIDGLNDADGYPSDEYDAARVVFGLTVDETEHLFIPAYGHDIRPDKLRHDASAKDVAGLIRKFVASRVST